MTIIITFITVFSSSHIRNLVSFHAAAAVQFVFAKLENNSEFLL